MSFSLFNLEVRILKLKADFYATGCKKRNSPGDHCVLGIAVVYYRGIGVVVYITCQAECRDEKFSCKATDSND